MDPPLPVAHECLAMEAELSAGELRFVRERLRLPKGNEASFGWLRHPPSVLVVPLCGDGRVLVLRRYRPAVGRWVLEFPSGSLQPGESPAGGGERLMRQLTGHGGKGWQALGVLWPNPGYSDERMTLGLIGAQVAEQTHGAPAVDGGSIRDQRGVCLEHDASRGLLAWQLITPVDLEAALGRLEEPLDGRSISAWFLARQHWRT